GGLIGWWFGVGPVAGLHRRKPLEYVQHECCGLQQRNLSACTRHRESLSEQGAGGAVAAHAFDRWVQAFETAQEKAGCCAQLIASHACYRRNRDDLDDRRRSKK